MTFEDWEDMLYKKAQAVADMQVAAAKKGASKERDWDADKEAYSLDNLAKLKRQFPLEVFGDNQKVQRFKDWSDEHARRWMSYGEDPWNKDERDAWDPFTIAEARKYASFKPLLTGESDYDWTKMSPDELKAKGYDLGYDVSTPDGNSAFMKQLTDYQNQYNRANILKEVRSDPLMFATSLVFPSLYEEAEKQIATGTGDESDVTKAGVLDGGVNMALFGAPGLRGFKAPGNAATRGYNAVTSAGNFLNPAVRLERAGRPYLGAFTGAAEQAGAEAARQYGKTVLDSELDPNLMMVMGAGAAGATRPGLIGASQGLFNQFGGQGMTDFARGVGAATRRGNPVTIEREAIQRAFPGYQSAMQRQSQGMGRVAEQAHEAFGGLASAGNLSVNPAVAQANQRAADAVLHGEDILLSTYLKGNRDVSDMIKYGRALGIEESRLANMKLADILDVYDNQMGLKTMKVHPNMEAVNPADAEYAQLFASTFPAKAGEMTNSNGAYRAGLATGTLLGDVGGRLEPMLKVGPTDLTDRKMSDYKESSWYKNLLITDPEKARAIDERMDDKPDPYSIQLLGGN